MNRAVPAAFCGSLLFLTACLGAASSPPPRDAAGAAIAGGDGGGSFRDRLGGHARWAVVIGVGDYADAAIPDPVYADDDARAFADFLRSPAAGAGGLPPENIALVTNEDATARGIRGALVTFLHQSGPEDVIYLFLAGHAALDPDRPADVYFLPHDADADELPASALPIEEIYDALARAEGRLKIVLADASHDGWVQVEDRRGLLPNPVNRRLLEAMNPRAFGFVALTASQPGRPSRAGRQYGGGHGVFTHFLLEGLRGPADTDRDGVVELAEMLRYTRDAVRRATGDAQVPTASKTRYDPDWPVAEVGRRGRR